MLCRKHVETTVIRAASVVNNALLTLSQQEGFLGGTTAVFALISERHFLLGHLGDSKAVSCHVATTQISPSEHECWQQTDAVADTAFQGKLQSATLTHNHSPDRPDELARILAAGGFVSRATAGELKAFCCSAKFNILPALQSNLIHCYASPTFTCTGSAARAGLGNRPANNTHLLWHIVAQSFSSH